MLEFKRSFIGYLLSTYMVSRKLKKSIDEVEVVQDQFGKPYIKGNDVYISLSHSGNFVICVCDDSPVGIDIEEIRPINLKLMSKLLSHNEEQLILNSPVDQRFLLFYKIWVIKESFSKIIGKGISKELLSRNDLFNNSYKYLTTKESEYYFKTINLDNYHPVSVCSIKKVFNYSIEVITEETFFEELNYLK